MNKKLITIAITTVIGGSFYAQTASAAMASNANLSINPLAVSCTGTGNIGTPPRNCNYGVKVDGGSYFGVDGNDDGTIIFPSEFVGITSNIGINVNTTQATDGDITHYSNGYGIFYGNIYYKTTVSYTTVLSDDDNGNVTMDFSGWNMSWNGIPNINLGGGTQDCGTDTDGICTYRDFENREFEVSGIQNHGNSTAIVTCDNTCEENDTYTLDYFATFYYEDPSGFGGIDYTLHLEGTIGASAVPVPAAAWLFGSGLLGLIGVARRKKS